MNIDLQAVADAAKALYIRALKVLPPDIKDGFARFTASLCSGHDSAQEAEQRGIEGRRRFDIEKMLRIGNHRQLRTGDAFVDQFGRADGRRRIVAAHQHGVHEPELGD